MDFILDSLDRFWRDICDIFDVTPRLGPIQLRQSRTFSLPHSLAIWPLELERDNQANYAV